MHKPHSPLPPSHNGADVTAALTATLAELGKVAAALSQQGQLGTATPVVNVSAQELVDALLDSIRRPMPKGGNTKKGIAGEVCPLTGLKRNALYELFNKLDENGRPVVESVSMTEDGEDRATRVYSPGSVLRYLREKGRQQAEKERNKKKK
jgi:hypothetical protein